MNLKNLSKTLNRSRLNMAYNRDIKIMVKKYLSLKNSTNDLTEYFNRIESEIKPEYKRLYNADSNFQYATLTSIKMMIRLNLSLRIIPFHQFAINIDLENL
jgi:hypothetical protein